MDGWNILTWAGLDYARDVVPVPGYGDRLAIGRAIAIGQAGGGETIERGVGGGVLGEEGGEGEEGEKTNREENNLEQV